MVLIEFDLTEVLSSTEASARYSNIKVAFDWEIQIQMLKSGFRILKSNAKSKNGFDLQEIRPQGGFQLRNPNPDFMDFLFTDRLGNPKKDLQNYSR